MLEYKNISRIIFKYLIKITYALNYFQDIVLYHIRLNS